MILMLKLLAKYFAHKKKNANSEKTFAGCHTGTTGAFVRDNLYMDLFIDNHTLGTSGGYLGHLAGPLVQ